MLSCGHYRSGEDEPITCPNIYEQQSCPSLPHHVYSQWDEVWDIWGDVLKHKCHPRKEGYSMVVLCESAVGQCCGEHRSTVLHRPREEKHPGISIHGCPCHAVHNTAMSAGAGFFDASTGTMKEILMHASVHWLSPANSNLPAWCFKSFSLCSYKCHWIVNCAQISSPHKRKPERLS